jgi:hypothetical protein
VAGERLGRIDPASPIGVLVPWVLT